MINFTDIGDIGRTSWRATIDEEEQSSRPANGIPRLTYWDRLLGYTSLRSLISRSTSVRLKFYGPGFNPILGV